MRGILSVAACVPRLNLAMNRPILTGAHLDGVKLAGTIMPDGSVHE